MSYNKEWRIDYEYGYIQGTRALSSKKEAKNMHVDSYDAQEYPRNRDTRSSYKFASSSSDLINYSVSSHASQSHQQFTPITPCFPLRSPNEEISIEKNPRLEINYLVNDLLISY
jgi:hypothetical protein